jgi:hypothetical protein
MSAIIEFSQMLEDPQGGAEWARKVTYNCELSAAESEMNAAADALWKEIGRTGFDRNHDLSALMTKVITPDVVTAPGELLSRMFNEGTIGEFDDTHVEVMPKNTLTAHESVIGGNVDASYMDHSIVVPTRKSLAIETYIPYQELRRGGYKNVANYLNWAREAFEMKKVSLVMAAVSAAIGSGSDNYINESSAAPTDTSMLALALYLHDMVEDGSPFAFGLNKYIQAVANLDKADKNKTDTEKSMWFSKGFIPFYSGVALLGFSGQKLLADGSYQVPNNTIIGVAGKIGTLETIGSLNVYETMDNDKEQIHLKMNGYTFSYAIADATKVAKIVIA